MCNFNPAKPVQTRDGRPARIVSTNMGGRYPILAIIDEGQEGDHASRYTMKGRFMTAPGESELDLVNVPEGEFYNVYLRGFHEGDEAPVIVGPHTTQQQALDALEQQHAPDSFTIKIERTSDGMIDVPRLWNNLNFEDFRDD